MNTAFQITFDKNNGTLHVQPEGDFDGTSAWELLNFLNDQYSGQGRVVIDTSRLRQIHPFGSNTFKCRLKMVQLPSDRLFFMGQKCASLAPEGSNVITAPEPHRCRCNGKCKQCKCAEILPGFHCNGGDTA